MGNYQVPVWTESLPEVTCGRRPETWREPDAGKPRDGREEDDADQPDQEERGEREPEMHFAPNRFK